MAQSQPTSAREAVRGTVPDLIKYSETVLFGEVWERPGLSKRDRSLIVVATLIALGRERQLVGHLERALDNGVTKNPAGGERESAASAAYSHRNFKPAFQLRSLSP
jgi:4-carboxymuconolactone decarboxylase